MTHEEESGEKKTIYVLGIVDQRNIVRLKILAIQMWKQGMIPNPVIRLKCACLYVCVFNFFT